MRLCAYPYRKQGKNHPKLDLIREENDLQDRFLHMMYSHAAGRAACFQREKNAGSHQNPRENRGENPFFENQLREICFFHHVQPKRLRAHVSQR
mgnify:CR=1 FL=1